MREFPPFLLKNLIRTEYVFVSFGFAIDKTSSLSSRRSRNSSSSVALFQGCESFGCIRKMEPTNIWIAENVEMVTKLLSRSPSISHNFENGTSFFSLLDLGLCLR